MNRLRSMFSEGTVLVRSSVCHVFFFFVMKTSYVVNHVLKSFKYQIHQCIYMLSNMHHKERLIVTIKYTFSSSSENNGNNIEENRWLEI